LNDGGRADSRGSVPSQNFISLPANSESTPLTSQAASQASRHAQPLPRKSQQHEDLPSKRQAALAELSSPIRETSQESLEEALIEENQSVDPYNH